MKQTCSSAHFFLLLILTLPTPTHSQVPTRGLVAHFALNGNAVDASPFANHGSSFGAVTPVEDRFGNPCSALFFDGQSGYLQVKSSPSLESPSSQVSISAWVKLEPVDLNTELQWLTICCKSNEPGENVLHPQYRLQTTNVTISLNTAFTEPHQQVLSADVWHHYALVYDGREVKTYLDGSLIFTFPYSDFLIPSNTPLEIGRDVPGDEEYFHGSMDDLRIYNRALNKDEILQLKRETYAPFNYGLSLQCPPNQTIQVSPNKCEALVNYPLPEANSDCSQPQIRRIAGKGPGKMFEVGIHVETYEASLPNQPKAECSFSITVEENATYRLVCPKDTVIWVKAKDKGSKYRYPSPHVIGGCQNVRAELIGGKRSGAFFPVGRHPVLWKADPGTSAPLHCSFKVVVKRPVLPDPVVTPRPPVKPKPDDPVVSLDTLVDEEDPSQKIKLAKSIPVKSPTVRLYLYDHQEQDGDIVSINFNGEWLLDKHTIKRKKKTLEKNKYLDITFPQPGEYILYSKAWNLGRIPPNTLTVELHDEGFGYKPRVFQLESEIGISEGIRLVYDPN